MTIWGQTFRSSLPKYWLVEINEYIKMNELWVVLKNDSMIPYTEPALSSFFES